jgi:endonuclease-8
VVLRTARRLHAGLAGRPLTTTDLRWPSLATVDLTGRDVIEVVAAGKHLLLRVAGRGDAPAVTLHSHLRMEGSWHLHRTGEPWVRRRSESGIRAVLANAEWTAVGHKLGMLDLVATEHEGDLVGHLGPDILTDAFDAEQVAAAIQAQHGDRTVGESLLDQRNVAGIGTFYLGEACFLRGVNPWSAARDRPDLPALLTLARRLMTANLDRAVQVTTGDARKGQEQYVHARSGRPCRRCGTTVRVAPIGVPPHDRVVFWCPSCQPGPVPTDDGRPQRPLGAGPRARPSAYRR